MEEIIKTNVCIIGAGPSGAATSIMLSNHKIPHYIIDKASFPRDKTCGDGLILYAYKALKMLGDNIFNDFLNNSKFIHSKKIKLHVNNNLNVCFKESEDRDMVISYAKRIDFDYFLVNNLSEDFTTKELGNGVKSLQKKKDGVLVKLKDGKQIFSKLIVGADGAQSLVARKLSKIKIDNKYRSTFVSAYFKNIIDLPTDKEAEIRIIYKKIPLFFYVFPLYDGLVNVTLGARSDKLNKHNINLIDEVENIISTNKKVKDRFINAEKVTKWRGWIIPFHLFKQPIVGDNYLLVGDAAGLANAFYKEGVGTGMMSGIIAANNIKECLKKDDYSISSLKNYDLEIKKEFGKLLKFSFYALRFTKFKKLFSYIVSIFKNKLERKSYDMIKKRSY